MREFGVRRYGDTLYHHCMADSAADAANWFAHAQAGIAGKDFQALVKDVTTAVVRAEGGSFEDVAPRVWVFPTEIPDGQWGGRGVIRRSVLGCGKSASGICS